MFCQSCVHFAFAHVAVHMFQSFVIRCIILNTHLCILCQFTQQVLPVVGISFVH